MTLEWPTRTLRGRLTLGHALIVLVSIVAFAFTARVLVQMTQRTAFDERVQSVATAIQLLSTPGDPLERSELDALVGSELQGAVFDARGDIVLQTAPFPAALQRFAIQAASFGPKRIVKVAGGGVKYRVVAFAVNVRSSRGSAVLWRVVDTMNDADNRVSLVFAIAIPLIVAAAFVAGNLLTRRSIATLEAVTLTARTIEATDLSRRIEPIPRAREIAELCETLNRMFARLEEAFERQRRFTADASHELRTPLSVIMAEADLGSDGLDDEREYLEAMRVILREAHTIEALTSDLLALARREAASERPPVYVDLADAARSAVERLERLARIRGMKVRSVAGSPALIKGDPSSIGRIPISLLHNALKFSNDGATIDVAVETHDGTVRLVVEDDGPGFSSDGLAHALDRFWRGESRSRSEGSGLGLAILATLAESARGTIELANRAPHGARVVVTFPAARTSDDR